MLEYGFCLRPAFNGTIFRWLAIVDNFSRFCQAIQVGKSLKGPDVVEVMEAMKRENQLVPKRIQVNNGSKFLSKELDKWVYESKVTLDTPALLNLQIIRL